MTLTRDGETRTFIPAVCLAGCTREVRKGMKKDAAGKWVPSVKLLPKHFELPNPVPAELLREPVQVKSAVTYVSPMQMRRAIEKAGTNVAALCRKLNIPSESAVSRWIREGEGIGPKTLAVLTKWYTGAVASDPQRKRGQAVTHEELESLNQQVYASGLSCSEIAKRHGWSGESLRTFLNTGTSFSNERLAQLKAFLSNPTKATEETYEMPPQRIETYPEEKRRALADAFDSVNYSQGQVARVTGINQMAISTLLRHGRGMDEEKRAKLEQLAEDIRAGKVEEAESRSAQCTRAGSLSRKSKTITPTPQQIAADVIERPANVEPGETATEASIQIESIALRDTESIAYLLRNTEAERDSLAFELDALRRAVAEAQPVPEHPAVAILERYLVEAARTALRAILPEGDLKLYRVSVTLERKE